jgi:protein SCO1/2
VVLPVLGLLLLLLTACSTASSSGYASVDIISGAPSPYRGTYIEQAYALPTATWADTSGAAVSWPRDGLPHPVQIIFFAYTHCPDVCGTQLADATRAIRGLPEAVRAKVGLTMITVDPKRDNAATLRAFLDRFDPAFVGLRTADTATLDKSAAALGVGLDSANPATSGYQVAHGAQLIGFGPAGTAPVIWLPGVAPSDITADLMTLATQA